jgi:hypothetical protein
MKTIRYGDSKDFYRTLHATIVSGEPAAVETEFTSMSDTPKRVRDVFRLDEVADPTWVDSFTGKFIPGAKVPRPTKPDLRMVIALATAAIGAGAGGLAAGPIGGRGWRHRGSRRRSCRRGVEPRESSSAHRDRPERQVDHQG